MNAGDWAKQHPKMPVLIASYADPHGSEATNVAVTRLRAQAVIDWSPTAWKHLAFSVRTVEIVSDTAVWYHPGRLVPIRYVLVRDVAG